MADMQTDGPTRPSIDKVNSVIESDRRTDNGTFELRMRLIEVFRSMTEDDIYYFHHQMKKHLTYLKSDIQSPLILFTKLIVRKLITSQDVKVIEEAFYRMKRYGLIQILKEGDRVRKTNTKSQSSPNLIHLHLDKSLSDEFILTFCTEEIGPQELMKLGVRGFKLQMVSIQRAQYDFKTTVEASTNVFTQWKNAAPFPTDTSWIRNRTMPPFTLRGLGQALRDAELNYTYRKYLL